MSNIDVNTLKDGDEVLVRGEVYGKNMIKFRNSHNYHTISIDGGYDIVSVEPRPLAVGDKVVSKVTSYLTGVVRHIEGKQVAILENNNSLEIWDLDVIQRA